MRRFYAVMIAIIMMVTSLPQTMMPIFAESQDANAVSVSGNEIVSEETMDQTNMCVYTLVPADHVKYLDYDTREEITKITATPGTKTNLRFRIQLDEGYTVKKVTTSVDRTYLQVSGSPTSGVYNIRPGKATSNVHEISADIYFETIEIAEYTANFSINSDDVTSRVFINEDQEVNLVNGSMTVRNDQAVTLELKVKSGKKISKVWYKSGSGDSSYSEELIGSDDDNDGYIEYYIGRRYEDYRIVVESGKECTLTFNLGDYLELSRVDFDGTGYSLAYEPLEKTVKTITGQPYYFTTMTFPNRGEIWASTTKDDSGKLTPITMLSDIYPIYEITPTQNTTINVKHIPAKLPIVYDESMVADIALVTDGSEDPLYIPVLSEDKKHIEFREDCSFQLHVKPVAGKTIHSFYYVYEGQEEEYRNNYVNTSDTGYYYDYFYTGSLAEIGFSEGVYLDFVAQNADIYDLNGMLIGGESVVCAAGDSYAFTVEAYDRYEVAFVTTTGDESGKITPVKEEVNGVEKDVYRFVPTESTTVSVVTKVKEKQITFVNEIDSADIIVSENAVIQNNGTYLLDRKEDALYFDVTVSGNNVDLNVMTRDNNGHDCMLEAASVKTEDEKIVYSYIIEQENITGEMTVYISNNNAPKKLKIQYGKDAITDFKLLSKNEELEAVYVGEYNGIVEKIYEVEKGETVHVYAKTDSRFTIGGVRFYPGENTDPIFYEVNELPYENDFIIDVNSTILLNTRGRLFTSLKRIREDGTVIDLGEIKNNYVAYAGSTYELSVVSGNTEVMISETSMGEITEDGKAIRITIPSDSKNRNISIRYKVAVLQNGVVKDQTGSFSIRVVDPITSVQLKSSPKTHYADRRGNYVFEGSSSNTSFLNIGVKVELEPTIQADLVQFMWKPSTTRRATLSVWTNAKAGTGNIGNILLYDKEKLPGEDGYIVFEKPLVITEPTSLLNSIPEAEVVASDDISITVKLDNEYQSGCVIGKQYYKIDVTPKAADGEEIPDSIIEATKNPFFVVREFPEYDEEGNEIPGFIQKEKIIVNTAKTGEGQKCDFDVKVTLVQTYDKNEITAENANDLIAYSSKTTELKDVATKDPIFSVKLSLKKKTSQIYTTQGNILAANLVYDKVAVCLDATAEDTTVCNDDEKVLVKIDGDQLFVSATEKTKLGKHTIVVTPVGPESMYKTSATLVVNVVKGIETLDIELPATKIYKKDKTAATLTAIINYNEGMTAPKTKKVLWEIVNADGTPMVAPSEEESGSELYGLVTISNGKISVKKDLSVAEGDKSFCVKVTANDFAGNIVTAMSDVITITNQPLELGTMLIVQKNEMTGYYNVVAKGDGTVPSLTTDKLKNAQLVVLQSGVRTKAIYTRDDLEKVRIPASQLSVKSSAVKSIKLTIEDDEILIASGKPAKNIKLTVNTNDGGKKKAEMKVTIVYTAPKELALQISKADANLNDANTEELAMSFAGTVNTVLTVDVLQKSDGSDYEPLYAYTNHTVKISGGKLLSSDAEAGKYTVVVTGAKAKITLSDKVNKQNKVYEITNTNYNAAKAPSVKLKKKTPSSIVCGVMANRTLEYDVTSKTYDFNSKFVKVEMDEVSAAKKATDYAAFAEACTEVGTYVSVSDNKLMLHFTEGNIPLGTYKVTLTFGTMNNGVLVSDAKPVSINVKVVKPKVVKGTFKLKTTYSNVVLDENTKIELTATAKNVHSVEYLGIMGANVKGKENKFLDYFVLDGASLKVKDGLTAEQLNELKSSKTDNYGYLTYKITHGDNGYGVPLTDTKTVKITIKFK